MRTLFSAACTLCLLMTFGCGGDGGGGPSDTAASLTAAGWALFEQGEYEAGMVKFNQALALDATYADAHNGLGWSKAKLDSLAGSLDSFGQCITFDNAVTDAYAGCAPVYRDYEAEPAHFDSSIASASQALSMDLRYSFEHDTSFDWHDLHLIMAQSRYGLGEFLDAKAHVDSLPGHVTLDPESDTFVEDLAAEIERLEGIYGG
jgi:tetratricopeptide (TPR) repeat protein